MTGVLAGKTALITGAAGGLGRAFALALAAAGAGVAAADLDAEGARETAALVEAQGGRALGLGLDVTDEAACQAAAAGAADAFGRLDVLLNNAAVYAGLERKPFYELEAEAWDRVMAVNLKGAWLCAKAAFPYLRQGKATLPHLQRPGGGKIINVASATVFSGSPLWAHYVASKGGLIALTRVMAREAGPFGITANALAPGFTLTEASLGLIENAEQYGVDRGAIRRNAQPEDIVGAAVFLASPASDFITGQTLVVDGGRQFI
jgi:NAD(P)-dependent dehydrogenase (short-subunit alcohol dehydrogenase family)